MNLRSIVHQLRAHRATINQIDIILALIEVDAMRNLFFSHISDEERIDLLLSVVRDKAYEWSQNYNWAGSMPFLNYLAKSKELDFVPEEVETIISKIKEKGEENYEFTRIDQLDKEGPGPEIVA